jgi:hypothetical protein
MDYIEDITEDDATCQEYKVKVAIQGTATCTVIAHSEEEAKERVLDGIYDDMDIDDTEIVDTLTVG